MAEGGTAKRSVPQVSLFYRLLYRSYSRGSVLSLFLNRRVTTAGWVVLSLLLLTAILGVDLSKSTVYQVFSLVFGLLVVSLVWSWARRARLSARRELPRYATVGESFPYMVTVRNEGRHSVRGFLLSERAPDARPSLSNFAFTQEPGERERNAFDRFFVYYRWRWLMERCLLFKGEQRGEHCTVHPGESLCMSMNLTPQRRGVVCLSDLRARLPDPFGLFQRCRRVEARGDTLVVFPRRYRLPDLNLPGEACSQLGGEVASNAIGQSGEFLGLRDYRSGDVLRHIHWKGWAKTGRPIVKEFEDIYFPHYGLILDNFTEQGDDDLFEESVSVAASFACAIDTKRSLLDLMFIKDEAIVVKAGRGEERSEKLLEVLAAVEAEPEEHLDDLERLVKRHGDRLTACICVFTGWTPERASFLRRLVSAGMNIMALILSRSASKTRAMIETDPLPCRHLVLEASNVEEGLLKLQT
ncbi:MAG: DUF58 domain-containing protein [Roseibacillus sp.]|nr:DUF58 domain-containing protein [Roseibacillus sp.]